MMQKPSTQSGYAPINGLQLYYEIHGQGSPLVLIHGGGSTIESNFSEILPELAKTRQVIAIEEQGHGHTKAVDRPFTFENSADDVAGLLDHLKIAKADVFGFSNGGSIAMRVAIRHPQKVNKLIVASSQYTRSGMVAGFWDGMQHASLDNMPQALKDADRKINPDPKHLEQLFLQDSQRMIHFKDWPAEDLKAISAPTLLIIGDQDVVTADHVLEMHRLIPNSRLAILPANHGSYLGEIASRERGSVMPEVTVMILNQFLST